MAEITPDNLDRRARDMHNKALAALERNNIDYAIEMWQQCLAIAGISPKAASFCAPRR